MIGLDNPQNEIPHQLLATSGSFSWWYIDIIGDNGCGAVVIWGYGLPFLPQRTAQPPNHSPAQKYPSLTISIYDQGKEDFYLFQEFEEQDTGWLIKSENQADSQLEPALGHSIPVQNCIQRWTFGDTTIISTKHDGQVSLTLKLNCQVPAECEDLVGTITCSGHIRPDISLVLDANGEPKETTQQNDPRHQWTPVLTMTKAHVDLRCSDQNWHFTGRAYHDRNAGQIPLGLLGIRTWWWGRVALPEGELIWYQLHPTASSEETEVLNFAVWCSQTETVIFEHISCTFNGKNYGKFGLNRPKTMTLSLPSSVNQSYPDGIKVVLAHCVDDSPFYQRLILNNEGRSMGFTEQIRPDRIGQSWQQPFVRMRVHSLRSTDKNSLWLPLFSGPATGRWKRLISRLCSAFLGRIGFKRSNHHSRCIK